MKRTPIKKIFSSGKLGERILVKGWVRTFRNNQFISINDGSTINNIQAVIDSSQTSEDIKAKLNPGASVSVLGALVESLGKGQSFEVQVEKLDILGESDPQVYPLQPKKHSLEFLREKSHLRPRTNTIGSVLRIRNEVAYGIHQFFYERGFYYLNTPIITGSDAEGAGETFRVTNFDIENLPLDEEKKVDFKQDFFGKPVNLTVSGQLEAEAGAMSLGNVYTFGPTFRAENSNTSRHLAEFWMIEPEMAFVELEENIEVAEEMLKYLIKRVVENCNDDLEFLDKRLADEEKTKPEKDRSELGLVEKLKFVLENEFEKISYSEAIDILKNSKPNKKKKFKFPVEWGIDLQSEHERFLVEKHFKKPIVVYDYPKGIKAFYMKQNDDGKTVRAMDVLFPGIGEIIGGSQREEGLDKLKTRMQEMNVLQEDLWWYLELRKFGTAPHSGFGLGFERFVQFVTGMGNIRDVCLFPRFPQHAEF